jgi:amino acid permease
MTQAARCDTVDFNGVRCGLQAGHSGQHGAAIAAKQRTSFARIVIPPLLVMVAAIIIGVLARQEMAALAIGATISVISILVAWRRER